MSHPKERFRQVPPPPGGGKGGSDFGVKAYDQFWVAPGERLALVKGEFRSSYVVDPPNGRVPRPARPAIAHARRRDMSTTSTDCPAPTKRAMLPPHERAASSRWGER